MNDLRSILQTTSSLTPTYSDRFFFGGDGGVSKLAYSCVFVKGFNNCAVVKYPFAGFEINGEAVVGALPVDGETAGISPYVGDAFGIYP
jgi:hypothetical protein